MNEKIKELAEQARAWVNNYENVAPDVEYTVYRDAYDKKFAELIIRKCARLCDNHGNKVEDDRPNKDLSSAAFDCSDIIREHFDIK